MKHIILEPENSFAILNQYETGIPYVESPGGTSFNFHQRTFALIEQIPAFHYVAWDCTGVADIPLVTLGCNSCRTIGIKNGSKGGLTHFSGYEEPDCYINEIMQRLDAVTKAVVVAGNEKHGDMDLADHCRTILPLSNVVYDNQIQGRKRPTKDIIFDPKTGIFKVIRYFDEDESFEELDIQL